MACPIGTTETKPEAVLEVMLELGTWLTVRGGAASQVWPNLALLAGAWEVQRRSD